MRVLAIEKELTPKKSPKSVYQKEASEIYRWYKAGKVREIFFAGRSRTAVILLEVKDEAEAKRIVRSLPLVPSRAIEFDIIELTPYDGLDRILER